MLPLLGIVVVLTGASADAQQQPMPWARLSQPTVLDGAVDDVARSTVSPLPLPVYQPTYGGEPTERTEVGVAHGDD